MQPVKGALIASLLSLLSSLPASQGASTPARERLHVDASAPPGGSGASWGDALADLQQALSIASERPVREIWVAAGTYHPAGPGGSRDATFSIPRRVEIYGGFTGVETRLDQRDPVVNRTVLSGDLNGDDANGYVNYGDNVTTVVTLVDSDARLDGLIVRAGHADLSGLRGSRGAGVFVLRGAPTFVGVELLQNVARTQIVSLGGGLYAEQARPVFRACTFRKNSALDTANSFGGGAFFLECDVLMEDCSLRDGTAHGGGGGLASFGGEIRMEGGELRRNQGTLAGGGLYANSPVRMDLLGLFVQGNQATSGGGLELVTTRRTIGASIEDCTFLGNFATAGGGFDMLHDDVLSSFEGVMPIRGCTFRNNGATSGGGFASDVEFDLRVEDCEFEGNEVTTGGGFLLFGGSFEAERCRFRDNALSLSAGSGAGGCGVYLFGADSVGVLRNCSFFRNERDELWANFAHLRAENCTFVHDNSVWPALRTAGSGRVELESCILWGGNTTRQGDVRVTYSDVRGGASGVGNIDQDPLFASAAGGNQRLQPGSPCIDAGRPDVLPPGESFYGDPRLLDGDLDGVLRVDMGADEFAPVELAARVAGEHLDVTTTGATGTSALLLMGLETTSLFVEGLGFVSVAPAVVLVWPAAPGTSSTARPGLAPGTPLHLQLVVFFDGAATLTNRVDLTL